MKKFYLILFCFFSLNLYSQNGKIEYEYIDKQHNVLRKSLLLFNENKSSYVENKKGLNNLDKYFAKTIFQPQNGEAEVEYIEKVIITDTIGNIIYRDFEEKKLLQRIIKNFYFNNLVNYIVEDYWTDLNWVILDSLKLIEGYNCKKALTNFRGRKYEGWFTDSIQVPFGPWKLFGLPGLILELREVEENLIYIKAKKINFPITQDVIINRPIESTVISIKEQDAFLEKQAELRFEANKSQLPRGFTGMTRGKRLEPYFYRKLERKYEWEE